MSLTARASSMLVPLVLLAACASAGMDVPHALEGADRLTVEGRGGLRQARDLRFGAYEAVGIQRSWTRGSGWRAGLGGLGGGTGRARQSYGFTVTEEGREYGQVECEATGSRGTVGLGSVGIDVSSGAGLYCTMGRSGDPPAWTLTLHATRDRHLTGELVAGESTYHLTGTGPGGKLSPATTRGYELRADDRVVAAVETVNRGAVWFAPDLEPAARPGLAAAAVSLLLYQKVDTD